MSDKTSSSSGRLLSLDYLRGYFILVIIIDHLWKFPSAWALMSGQAKLWVTAAEGFVIISGFMIGYIRGRKGLKLPFPAIARKLISRAALLYAWMVIASMGYITLEWSKLVPNIPYTKLPAGDYGEAFMQVVTGNQPHVWIHFLYLYAIFLALAVVAVYLLRHRQAWLLAAATLTAYLFGLILDVEWMKWQLIFFVPSIAGFYFENIRAWWQDCSDVVSHQLRSGLWALSGILLLFSILTSFAPWALPEAFNHWSAGAFVIEGFSPLRVIVAGLWFVSLALIFERITPWLQRHTFGIIEYLGTHSLTAYIAHGYMICLVNYVFTAAVPAIWDIPYNTLLGLITILATYAIIRLPIIRSVLPR